MNSYTESIYAARYYTHYNKTELLSEIQQNISKDILHINEGFSFIFDMMLKNDPNIYWNRDAYQQTLTNLESLRVSFPSISIDDNCFEYFLMGYNSYDQLSKIILDLRNFNISSDIKMRLYYLPTYTSLVEGCVSNFTRFICSLLGQAVGKDYASQNALQPLMDILQSHNYTEIVSKIDVNIRNAINHGKVKLMKGAGSDSIRFFYTKNHLYQQLDLFCSDLQRKIDALYDVAGAMLLAIATFLNNNNTLLLPFGKEYLNFELLALNISIPGIHCTSISDTESDKQLNIEIEIENTSRSYIGEIACLLAPIIYSKYDKYKQYMLSFSNLRMQSGWVRYKNEELAQIISTPKNIDRVFKAIIERKDYIIFNPSEEKVDLNEIKYFCFPNISRDTYKINHIEDGSNEDRKRLRANLFLGDVTTKDQILDIINDGIEQLKYVKNPPSATFPHKYGSMEADSLYVNVYRYDTRKNKELFPGNQNFICRVDYNINGITTLKNGGIGERIWNQLYHETLGNLQIAWREGKYAPKAISSKVGRNELCPCGSGKKYKKCCLK